MKAKPSPLEIVDFAILNFELKFIAPTTKEELSPENWAAYEIDIDFKVSNQDYLRVFIKATINSNGLPGYKISAESACVFQLNDSHKLSLEEKNSMKGYSTIYIALNCLRGFIVQFTASAPLGRYILPSVDLNDLITQKKELLNSGEHSQPVKKKRTESKTSLKSNSVKKTRKK